MLQRPQSLLLLIIALLHVLTFFIPVFTWQLAVPGTGGETYDTLTALYNIPCIVINAVIILFSIIIVFQYKNRKQQISFCYICMLLIILNTGLYMYYMISITGADGNTLLPARSIGIWFYIVSIVLAYLAARRIKKDDDLVKSVDRIR